jgi:DNA-binding NarL/FixJ family response regulator
MAMQIEVLMAWADVEAGAALARLLEREAASRIVCELTNLSHAACAAAAKKPQVLLVEAEPWQQTMGLLAQLAEANVQTRSLLAYDSCTHEQLVQAIRLGASGCVMKTVGPTLMAKAVRTLSEGGTWFCRGALLHALKAQTPAPAPGTAAAEEGKLTRREEEILGLIGQGLTNKEIGRRLDISDQTVKTHLHRVYAKLNRSGRYKAFLAQPARNISGLGAA